MRKLLITTLLIGLLAASFMEAKASPILLQATETSAPEISPVQTVTPNPDGSIVHIVRNGENLYTIAVAYGVTVNYLKDLNKLTTNDIYVNQKLIVRLAFTPAPTTPVTPTQPPTRTPRPTRTPTKIRPTATPLPPVETPTLVLAAEEVQSPPGTASLPFRLTDPLLLGILGMALLGGILMLAGSVMKRKR